MDKKIQNLQRRVSMDAVEWFFSDEMTGNSPKLFDWKSKIPSVPYPTHKEIDLLFKNVVNLV